VPVQKVESVGIRCIRNKVDRRIRETLPRSRYALRRRWTWILNSDRARGALLPARGSWGPALLFWFRHLAHWQSTRLTRLSGRILHKKERARVHRAFRHTSTST